MYCDNWATRGVISLGGGCGWRDECKPQGINISSSTHIFNPWGQVSLFYFFLLIIQQLCSLKSVIPVCVYSVDLHSWMFFFLVFFVGLPGFSVRTDETRLWSTSPWPPLTDAQLLFELGCGTDNAIFSCCVWQAKSWQLWNIPLGRPCLTAACPCGGCAGTDPDFSRKCVACYVCIIWV